MKIIHIIQHVPFEGPGLFEDLFRRQSIQMKYTRIWEPAHRFPDLNDFDGLLVMGGPMSVNDSDPWIDNEKDLVRRAIDSRKQVIGICLGAQMIASALGSKVYPGPEKEIGWHPIQFHPAAKRTFDFVGDTKVFHWHGETFDLPKGAELLASSKVCKNQAFRIEKNVIGLQFHLEMTSQGVSDLIENSQAEIESAKGSFVQSPNEMLNLQNSGNKCPLLLDSMLQSLI